MPFELPTPTPLPIFSTGMRTGEQIIGLESEIEQEKTANIQRLADIIPKALGQLDRFKRTRELAKFAVEIIPELKPRAFSTSLLKSEYPDLSSKIGQIDPNTKKPILSFENIRDEFDRREKSRSRILSESVAMNPVSASLFFREKLRDESITEKKKKESDKLIASAHKETSSEVSRLSKRRKELESNLFGFSKEAIGIRANPQRKQVMESEYSQITSRLKSMGFPVGVSQPQSPTPSSGKIKVVRLSDNQSGTINESDFDPSKYRKQ